MVVVSSCIYFILFYFIYFPGQIKITSAVTPNPGSYSIFLRAAQQGLGAAHSHN